MARDAAHSYTAAAYFDEEQHVVGHQTAPRKHLHRERVGTGKYIHMRLDELLPRSHATPLRCWSDVVSAQDVADRLVRDRMPQIG